MTPEQHHPTRHDSIQHDHSGGRVVYRQGGRHRDPVTALFAAALSGDRDAEDELRAAALINDRAVDALGALAAAGAAAALRESTGEPARTAHLDQVLAFLRPHLDAARAGHLAANGNEDGHSQGATAPGPDLPR